MSLQQGVFLILKYAFQETQRRAAAEEAAPPAAHYANCTTKLPKVTFYKHKAFILFLVKDQQQDIDVK